MATATETAPATATSNQVKIQDIGPARKRLTITVPADAVDQKLQESMSTLAHETVLPGFRKGKVPAKLLERRFGTAVRGETKNQLVASAYAAAIEEHRLKPVSDPEPGEGMDKLELEAGKPLTFSVEVEVVPTFELPSFEAVEVKKPMLEITEAHIDAELKRQLMFHGEPHKIEGDFQEGDRLIGYATVTRGQEAEPFFRQDSVVIIFPGKDEGGRGQVLGLMIDGLRALLEGKGIGDTVNIETVGPEAHEREDIRGEKLTMTYEIRNAERIAPATPEVVAERYGLPDPTILREQIKMALEHRRDEEQASAMREQAVDQLAESVEFDLPEKLSANQATSVLEQHRLELLSRGLTPEEAEERVADMRGDSEAAARERLKRFFLLHRLAEHFKVEVSEQEVNGRIAQMAAQRGLRPERLRAELAQAGRLGEVSRLIRDQKAADRLVQQAKKVEVSADEWNKIFKEKQGKAGAKSSGRKTSKKPKKGEAEDASEQEPKAKAKEPASRKKTSRKS